VFTARAICAEMYEQLLLYARVVFESGVPLRTVNLSAGIKLDDHTLDVDIICKFMLPAQLPVLFGKL
jgi:hypothetical protein